MVRQLDRCRWASSSKPRPGAPPRARHWFKKLLLKKWSANCCLKIEPSSSHKRERTVLGRHPHTQGTALIAKQAQSPQLHQSRVIHGLCGNRMSRGFRRLFLLSLQGSPVKPAPRNVFQANSSSPLHPILRTLVCAILLQTGGHLHIPTGAQQAPCFRKMVGTPLDSTQQALDVQNPSLMYFSLHSSLNKLSRSSH